ncbi:pyrroloquinoline quinone biosynthesis peptide chaperone PqqD [Methylocaldum szegediense]|jgi:pyrroloquinoline quinone biosynthesis protein D|uniref:PqqA binding protein n=1 Tax=Methylocaldum szegediense TaxID=73780 RepID=A0ABM9I9F9_9GAMM|nr:pyrroloquinoline quinone biosynthesis peptide chaperone PqqD [Methylocaldum szegediense]CAI8973876.1 PqqA binding protein [Methylocaldum szegediense]
MALDSKSFFAFSPLHRLQWEEAQQRYVILYPEGLVELNLSAAEILKLCDGTRDLDTIVSELEAKFETSGLRDDISELLQSALDNGWIRQIPRQ